MGRGAVAQTVEAGQEFPDFPAGVIAMKRLTLAISLMVGAAILARSVPAQ
jgi:hypothetical protein